MEPSQDTIIEAKNELMVSPLSGENPIRRTAYFIKPCMEDSTNPPHYISSGGTATVTSNHVKLPLEVIYSGWYYPHREWKTWVQQMQDKYEYMWIRAGIDQAIKASTFLIRRNDELIHELAQRWRSKTNTFVFPWGEATITLEDVKVCWGYSVMGVPFSSPLVSDEEKEVEQELITIFRTFFKSKAKRADHSPWMKYFMSNNESQVVHEAFLSLWLSRFVFPGRSNKSILKSVFPIAIHLARGTKVALAPAVLANIYRDLSLLNNKIRIGTTVMLEVMLWAPFQLVQVWALERFPALQPCPHVVEQGQLLMAKWHTVKMVKHYNLKLILDSSRAGNDFIWCPFVNSPPLRLHNKNDKWVCKNPNFDDELESFARCMRVSELVGMKCIEQYWPNRVAMQFGMDQDIPGVLVPYNENPWISYSEPTIDTNLYIALSARHQPNVTSRYYHWWKQSNPSKEGNKRDDCVVSSSKRVIPISLSVQKESCRSYGPQPGFTCKKIKREQEHDFDEMGKGSIIELSSSSSEGTCFGDEEVENDQAVSSPLSTVFPSLNVEEARSVKYDRNGVKIKNSFCDRDGIDDMEREYASPCIEEIASNLESRIRKLERVVASLKQQN